VSKLRVAAIGYPPAKDAEVPYPALNFKKLIALESLRPSKALEGTHDTLADG
jgi:hypothetical protein